jgi:hypothetical protein
MSGTSIPDVLDQLVAIWTAAGVAGLQVVDGTPYDVGNSFLAVGWDRSDQPTVAWTDAHYTAGGQRGKQAFDVSNLLSLGLGNDTMQAARRQIFTVFDVLAAAVAANRTLNGAVLAAWISAGDMTPAVSETGEYVDFRFTVHCDAVK